jgi:hypothetical protein
MKTTRRKFPIYPVAFAIALLIANSARAQLCPTAETTAGIPGLAAQTETAPALSKVSDPALAGHASFRAEPMQLVSDSRAKLESALKPEAFQAPATTHAIPTAISANQSSDVVVHKLLLAVSQPALAEASLQPMFAD